MATIRDFHDLEMWKRSRQLCQRIFQQILSNDELKDFPLKDQLNRSSSSVMDNIAEGFGRQGNKEFRQYLAIARASLCEARSQMFRAVDRGYISVEEHSKLNREAVEIESMIVGFSKYLVNSKYRGAKYKVEEPTEQYILVEAELSFNSSPNSEFRTQNSKMRI